MSVTRVLNMAKKKKKPRPLVSGQCAAPGFEVIDLHVHEIDNAHSCSGGGVLTLLASGGLSVFEPFPLNLRYNLRQASTDLVESVDDEDEPVVLLSWSGSRGSGIRLG